MINIDKFPFPIDFIVLDVKASPKIPLILDRSFMNTVLAGDFEHEVEVL